MSAGPKHKKLQDALSSLILRNTFFSALLLQQEFVESGPEHGCETMDVNGEQLRYNPEFIDGLDFDTLKGCLAHGAMHLALCHPNRMGKRDEEIWDKACDYTINGELQKKNFKIPKGSLQDASFDDKSAEDIYRLLAQNQKKNGGKNGNGNGSGGKQGVGICQMRPGAKSAAQAKADVMKAIATAKNCGDKSADFERIVKELQPEHDWREIIHRFFSDVCSGDYSWKIPNRRYIGQNIILPSMESKQIGKIMLACDTSGSISEAEISIMVSEILNCISQYQEEGYDPELTVIYCDAEVQRVEVLREGDVPHPKGGGGTAFAPVFRWIEKNGLDGAACLVYLTDMCTSDWADKEPAFPVLWGVIGNWGNSIQPPFGETFKFDVHQGV